MFLSVPIRALYIPILNNFINISSDFVRLSELINIIGVSDLDVFVASSLILSNLSNINLSICS
mgnify:CR=1 FL=1